VSILIPQRAWSATSAAAMPGNQFVAPGSGYLTAVGGSALASPQYLNTRIALLTPDAVIKAPAEPAVSSLGVSSGPNLRFDS